MIDIITNHKTLEYFTTTKVLTHYQAHWSEYLSAFNLVVCFHSGKLGEKPDTLTHQVDYYLKGGDRDFMLANLQNLHPVFTQEMLASTLRATCLQHVISCAASLSLVDSSIPLLNSTALLEDIKLSLQEDPVASCNLALCSKGSPTPHFSVSPSGLLLLDTYIYVPDF